MEPILLTVTAGGFAGAVGAGVTKLFALGVTQARMEQKIDDHVADETTKFAGFTKQLEDMSAKLPNGELTLLLTKLGQMEERIFGADQVPGVQPFTYKRHTMKRAAKRK